MLSLIGLKTLPAASQATRARENKMMATSQNVKSQSRNGVVLCRAQEFKYIYTSPHSVLCMGRLD